LKKKRRCIQTDNEDRHREFSRNANIGAKKREEENGKVALKHEGREKMSSGGQKKI